MGWRWASIYAETRSVDEEKKQQRDGQDCLVYEFWEESKEFGNEEEE